MDDDKPYTDDDHRCRGAVIGRHFNTVWTQRGEIDELGKCTFKTGRYVGRFSYSVSSTAVCCDTFSRRPFGFPSFSITVEKSPRNRKSKKLPTAYDLYTKRSVYTDVNNTFFSFQKKKEHRGVRFRHRFRTSYIVVADSKSTDDKSSCSINGSW